MQITFDQRLCHLPCHFCSGTELARVAHVAKAPAFLGCTNRPSADDLFLSFHLYSCLQCGLIQTDAESLETTYGEIHSEALGKTWEAHHTSLAHFIKAHSQPFQGNIKILELGASVQPIARRLPFKERQIWYVDPIRNAPFALEPHESYLSGFFPFCKPATEIDIIIASHVIEHVPQTHSFFQALLAQLSPRGKIFISIPQFETWLKKAYFNAISAEHVTYPFQKQLEILAAASSLTVHTELFEEHSLFAVFSPIQHSSSCCGTVKENSKSSISNESYLIDWISSFHKAVSLAQFPENHPFFITGASHLSQYLLLSNPNVAKKVAGVLDNSSRKWGKRLYGTPIEACSFETLKNHLHPFVILTPSPYAGEMKKQILEINPHTTLVELL